MLRTSAMLHLVVALGTHDTIEKIAEMLRVRYVRSFSIVGTPREAQVARSSHPARPGGTVALPLVGPFIFVTSRVMKVADDSELQSFNPSRALKAIGLPDSAISQLERGIHAGYQLIAICCEQCDSDWIQTLLLEGNADAKAVSSFAHHI